MNNNEILELAISKAIDGGWKQDLVWIHGNVRDKTKAFFDKIQIDEKYVYIGFDDYISINDVIFNHDFAKGLWGEELHHETFIVPKELSSRFAGTKDLDIKASWQHYLQQMVIAEDPIKYLKENT